LEILNAIAGLLVGIIVGLTGVGGGSLMAPILILIFGIAPISAVGTDLWFAAITKTVGGAVHHSSGGPDYEIVRRLAYGSIPATLLTLWVLSAADVGQIKSGLIMHLLGATLVATAILTLFRKRLHYFMLTRPWKPIENLKSAQTALTIAGGFVLGVLVTLTSVGAGALGATMLLVLYPHRLPTRRLVATDIVHAVPLTAVAGLGHLWAGNVNLHLLGMLLIGSIPGIILGSVLASHVRESLIRPMLSAVLAFAGFRLLV
jgi:uncharacterized membrane protein YfcA